MTFSHFVGVDVEDEPDAFADSTVYLIGLRANKWMAAFICPCGCKSLIKLNLLKESSPRWTVKIHKKGKVSIRPSVWRIDGCKSHFTLRKGRIRWVIDSNNDDFFVL